MTKEEVEGAYEMETGNVIVKRFEGLNPIHTPGVLVKITALSLGEKMRTMLYTMQW